MTTSDTYSRTKLLGALHRDLKIEPFQSQQKSWDSYMYRLVYTASRFWIATICANDDYGGTLGISKQTVLRRVRTWVHSMEALYSHRIRPLPPYKAASSTKDVCALAFDRMVGTGDLVLHENGATYRATRSRSVSLGAGVSAHLGLLDITDPAYEACKVSGLVPFTQNDDMRPWRPMQIKRELARNQSSWVPVANLGAMEFFTSYGKSFTSQESWTIQPRSEIITLGRLTGPYEPYQHYIVNTVTKRAHHLDEEQAKAIWFELRHETGRPAKFAIEISNHDDCAQISASVPLHHLPLSIRKWLDLVSWPLVERTDTGATELSLYRCVVHKDMTPAVQSMLQACHADVVADTKE